MTARLPVFIASMLVTAAGLAGHGLMNSFGGIEWLPDPGATPNQFVYRVDLMDEGIALRLARSSDEEMALYLRFAREKLAEVSTMIKAGDASSAAVAIDVYRDYIERAAATIVDDPADAVVDRRHRFIAALLEHIYIMSLEYLDMPLEIRAAVSPVFTSTMDHYDAQSAELSKREKDALFFKEEEIRWSLEMIRQARPTAHYQLNGR